MNKEPNIFDIIQRLEQRQGIDMISHLVGEATYLVESKGRIRQNWLEMRRERDKAYSIAWKKAVNFLLERNIQPTRATIEKVLCIAYPPLLELKQKIAIEASRILLIEGVLEKDKWIANLITYCGLGLK